MADHLRTVIDGLSPEDQADVAGYMAAPGGLERREAEFMARLPARMAWVEDLITEALPEGLAFEFELPGA